MFAPSVASLAIIAMMVLVNCLQTDAEETTSELPEVIELVRCKGCCGHPWFPLPTLEERASQADVIILGTLRSVSPTAIPMTSKPGYKMGFAYTFDVYEYIKGTGSYRLVFAADYCDEILFKPLPTTEEAIALVRPMLAKRNTRFDHSKKIIFLHASAYYGNRYYAGQLEGTPAFRSDSRDLRISFNDYSVDPWGYFYYEGEHIRVSALRALLPSNPPSGPN